MNHKINLKGKKFRVFEVSSIVTILIMVLKCAVGEL